MASEFTFFFEGVDSAPSDSHRSDDGATVIGAATPRHLPEPRRPGARRDDDDEAKFRFSDNPGDWYFDFIYARVFTAKQKLSARQWSGIIHTHHQRFGLEKIVLDPGGGGIFVKRELMADKQLINGIETDVTPLCDQVDGPKLVVKGRFIVHMFKRGDPGVEACWPDPQGTGKSMAGDELLKDALYSSMKEGVDLGVCSWPGNVDEWYAQRREEIERWPEERLWALKNLQAGRKQLQGIMVAMHEDGKQMFTKRGARQFSSVGHDDIALAHMYCYAAFLMWLRSGALMGGGDPEDEAGFSGS